MGEKQTLTYHLPPAAQSLALLSAGKWHGQSAVVVAVVVVVVVAAAVVAVVAAARYQ